MPAWLVGEDPRRHLTVIHIYAQKAAFAKR